MAKPVLKKKEKRKTQRYFTANGCSYSEPAVNPKTWENGGATLLHKKWRITYYFHDPNIPGLPAFGKMIPLKGMNEYDTLEERREAVREIIRIEKDLLDNYQYNPITKTKVEPVEEEVIDYEIPPSTPFWQAMNEARQKLILSKNTAGEVRKILNRIKSVIVQLKMDQMPISDVRRRHVIRILDQIKLSNPKFSASSFNAYRAYLQSIFKKLLQMEAVETNIINDIEKQKVITKIREIPTDEEIVRIKELLKASPDFERFCNIFFPSGLRETEIMTIRGKDVYLDRQEFKVTVKKGKRYVEQIRAITMAALPYWQEQMKRCLPEDYVFSNGLRPGPVQVNSSQITRRWKTWVKDRSTKNGGNQITVDIYALKYLYADLTDEAEGLDEARRQMGHTNEATSKIYTVRRNARELEKAKKRDIKF